MCVSFEAVLPSLLSRMYVVSFLLQIVGLACTGLSAYILVIKHKTVRDPIDFFFDPSCLLCTAGSITVVITFFGWMGALREYTCMLRTVGTYNVLM